jgi:hypothetical protein
MDWQLEQGGVCHASGLMTVQEMMGDLPCLEELWEAGSAAEFEAVVSLKGYGSWRRSASLRDCMEALVLDAWSGIDGFPLRHLSPLDLYVFISGETKPLSPLPI